jgi:predicted DNA-binding transcriptional regulator AlpA
MQVEDRLLWRRELQPALNNVSRQAIFRWMRVDKLAKPDVHLSQRSVGWRLSSMRAAGINLA